MLLWAVGDPVFAGAFFAGLVGAGGVLLLVRGRPRLAAGGGRPAPDVLLLRDALDSAGPSLGVALTDADGSLICASRAWSDWFGADALPPALARVAPTARRDGAVAIPPINVGGQAYEGEVRLAGAGDGQLLWRLDARRR